MDIIIPVLILAVLSAVVVYSTRKEASRNKHKEEPKKPPQYAHEPMDLRLKEE